MKLIPTFLHRFASPPNFYATSARWIKWLTPVAALLFAVGLFLALFVSPVDYQQGSSVRIMYVHVPSAWMSLFVYVVMAVSAAVGLIWNIKLASIVSMAAAPIGASFTAIALATGSLWGKPTWGTWWVWDARLTSELVLLFLYLGVIALFNAIEDRRTAYRAAGLLAIVGVINVPIVHYSVVWWNTLHQTASVSKMDAPSIHPSMLWPLLIMTVAFKLYFIIVLFIRSRTDVLEQEQNSRWVAELSEAEPGS